MFIYIDESGSFVNKEAVTNSWCTVVGYAVSEIDRKKCDLILKKVKLSAGFSVFDEIKIRDLEENQFFILLEDLSDCDGIMFSVATDSSLNTSSHVREHKLQQAKNLEHYVGDLHRKLRLSDNETLQAHFEALSDQLYIQFIVQTSLVHNLLGHAITYFAVRRPRALRNFRWRVDRKDEYNETEYENAFRRYAPAISQMLSIKEPGIMVDNVDYSELYPFVLETTHHDATTDGQVGTSRLNVNKIIYDDFKFVDSRETIGVQIADLLASGLRRFLRLDFHDNDRAAKLLGRLMVWQQYFPTPVDFTTLGPETPIDAELQNKMTELIENARPLFS